MSAIAEYLKNHPALTVVFAVILLLIVVFIVLLIVEIVRGKKRRRGQETLPAAEALPQEGNEAPAESESFAQPAPAESVQPAPEPAPAESVPPEPAPAENAQPTPEPAEEPAQKTPQFVFVPVKEPRTTGKKPSAVAEEQEETMKQEKKTDGKKPTAAPAAKPAKPAKPTKKEAAGKWVIFEEDRGGYGFKLIASNGEVMIKSSAPYASLSSAKSGVKTYQDNIAAGRLEVVETKKGNFFVQVNNASKRLLATSADYKTRSSCENAMESIKRWAATSIVTVENADEDDKK